MNYQAGDLLLILFPQTGAGKPALRPALVILDTGDAAVLVARVTTKGPTTPFDVPITDWHGAGLIAPSLVRLHKLATLEKTLVQRRLGGLQPSDRSQVSLVIRQTYGNW
jgi:mRNA interferase MazF